jgi:hypothetical protein
MRYRICLLALMLAAACRAEVIDRVAVTVGKRVITSSDVLREIRLSAFFNQTDPDLAGAGRRRAAERLAERALMETEMEVGRYPSPRPPEIEAAFSAMKKSRFPSDESYRVDLAKYGIHDEDVKLFLTSQGATLRFIDARFGPAVQVLESEMRDYYTSRFVPGWPKEGGKPAPPLDEVRQEIEESLKAQHVDRLLDEWLKEARQRTRIEFKEEAFK